LVGIGVTGSRGSWAATGVGLLFFFGILASHRSYRLPALLMMVLLGGASFYFVTRSHFFKQRAQPAISEGRLDLSVRYELWDATVRMWREHAWLGVGPGHFDYRFRVYRPSAVQLRPDRAHNEYLNLLADWGVAGAAIVGATFCVLFAGLVRTWRHVRRSEREFASNRSNKFAFVVGAAVGLVALLGHSAVDFNLQIPANAILAVTLMALLSSHLRFATEQYWISAGPVLKTLASLVLVTGIIYFAQQTGRLGREYVWLERASTKGAFSDEKIAALEKAFAVEPRNFGTAFALGESYRTQSFEGGEDYEALAQKAMLWYSRGTNTNPHDGYNFLGYGRCLDYVGRTNESRAFFYRADELDPNGYLTSAFVGRHYVEVEDYAAARQWLERSAKLQKSGNPVATNWLGIVNRKLLEGATNPTRVPIR
jgi:tetratricopeptide (TPR) repeat protein